MTAPSRTWGESHTCEPACTTRAVPRRYLNPGDMLVTAEVCELTTILGSCVAVCLWDQRLRIGGMNHFLLPRASELNRHPGRFGNTAMRALLDAMLQHGSRRADLIAKVFGGAQILERRTTSGNLSDQNVTCASDFLTRQLIHVAGGDTGGPRGRHITFLSDSGAVALRRL